VDLLDIELIDDVSPPVLRVAGEVDLASAQQLREALRHAVSVDRSVVVDMKGVAFIDAAGLRVVLEAAESLNGAGPLTLRHAPLVARLLKLVGLSDLPSIVLLEEGPADG
jgi:anti-anti-sigma factor